ncbi:MAG: DNA repair protein RecO [Nitrospinae bacterium]|nr:DNA repair protein RecO [Nitrospinota bacterium]
MKLLKTKAIVIKKTRISEGDAIVTVFTESSGKLRFWAKGLYFFRNKYHGMFESGACVFLTYSERGTQGLCFFNSCEIVDPFKGIWGELQRMFAAFYFLELVDSWLKESDANPSVFHLLHGSLSLLEGAGSYETLVRVFELRMLALTGYSPKLDACVLCGKGPGKSCLCFNFEKGGIICSHCSDGKAAGPKVSPGALAFAAKGIAISGRHIERLKIPRGLAQEVEILSHHFLVSRLGKKLKSYRFLEL